MPPSARNGPSARCILRARRPLLGSNASVGTTTEQEADDDGDDDRAPEEEAEHEHELDVADPHAGRRQQRGHEQEEAGAERREPELGQVGEPERGAEHEPGDRRAAA